MRISGDLGKSTRPGSPFFLFLFVGAAFRAKIKLSGLTSVESSQRNQLRGINSEESTQRNQLRGIN